MKSKIIIFFSILLIALSGCTDYLDRNALTKADNEKYWTNEDQIRFYSNSFYPHLFVGYGAGADPYTIYTSYTFNDDMLQAGGSQTEFLKTVPETGVESTSATLGWHSQYTGPNWNFYLIRKANVMLENIESRMTGVLTEEQYNHWIGMGRFFRALEYARLVNVFGDIPYYDFELQPSNIEELYKDRTPRNQVMDAVYDDFVFAMNNTRLADGVQRVNRYVIASFVSRWALVEGSWQKYHYSNNERAEKFFNLAVDAANIVIGSGNYGIDTDFHTLFGSKAPVGKENILYRSYDLELGITHSVASNCTPKESRNMGATLSLIKAFICNDGNVYDDSTVANADDFSLSEMIKTRDPRFEATFYDKPHNNAKGSLLMVNKFISREGLDYLNKPGENPPIEFTGNKNVNGYPVMRYGEVLLNWIEAKAELEDLGKYVVTSADIEGSINLLRKRPIDAIAIAKGVKETKPMNLSQLPNDPNKDPKVPNLLWEIRRERRMELALEHSRIIDLRRWKKLEYMDTDKNKDLLRGTWANLAEDIPADLDTGIDNFQVTDKNGVTIVYDGSNDTEMVGFFSLKKTKGRMKFLDVPSMNPYLRPLSVAMMKKYHDKNFTLSQTEGWPKSDY